MIRVIIYCMKMKPHLPAGYMNLKILAFLKDGTWKVLPQILRSMRSSNTYNPQRVKNNMIDLKKLQLVLDKDDWNKLQPQEKKEEFGKNFDLERAVKEHGAKNLYKITSRGQRKFDKIKNNCLDRDTQIIMGIPYSEGEDKDYMGSAGTKDIDE